MSMVIIDFETYYSKEFSLSKVTTEAYIRSPQFQTIGFAAKVDDGPIEWHSAADEDMQEALNKYHLEDYTVVAHNAAFDCAILNWRYGIKPMFIIDTLSMARPIIGLTQACSLKNLSEYYGIGQKGEEVYNTIGKRLEDFTPDEMVRFGEYCKQDVNLTAQLLPKLMEKFPREELELIDLTIRMFTEPVIELDQELLEKHLDEVVSKKQALLDKVGHDDRDAFMSNDKFAELLKAEGVDPPTKVSPTTGKEAYAFAKTDDAMKNLLNHPNERVQALVAARLGLKTTIEETRTQSFIDISRRGAMPIMLLYYGAANTGRFSGGDKLNPQNLPRGGALRYSMKAPEGYAIAACDSSNVEARTLAWFAGEENLLTTFRKNGDVYSEFASKVFNKPINKHDNPQERFVGKTCILGLGYGTGGAKLQRTLHLGGCDITVERAKEIVGLYRSSYLRIPALWKACQNAIRRMFEGYADSLGVINLKVDAENKTIELPNGMKMRYPDLQREQGEIDYEYTYARKKFRSKIYGGSLTENLIQALARIVVCQQMLLIQKLLNKRSNEMNDGKIRRVVHMVHDEVVVCVPEDEAENTQKMMELVMSRPPKWAEGLPVNCEAGGGRSYGDAK